jgi:phosphoglycerate dehydrogenase-like enzyme
VEAAAAAEWIQYVGAGADRIVAQVRSLRRSVTVVSAKGLVGPQLAEHALALLLSLTRGVARAIRSSGWDDRIAIRLSQWELTDRTLVILGLGGAGREVAQRARGFGFRRIIGVDPLVTEAGGLVDELMAPDELDAALGKADVVILTLPLTPRTDGLFGPDRFAALRDGAILINVSRGGIIRDGALVDALRSGRLAGAGLDVTEVEPLPADHPLWTFENVVITPHIAGGSPRREERLVEQLCNNLLREEQGRPLLGRVSLEDGF